MEKSDELATKSSVEVIQQVVPQNKEIVTEGVTPLTQVDDGYFVYKKGLYKADAIRELDPSLYNAINQIRTNHGTSFPKIGTKGDLFVRTDVLPNRLYKFDGVRWIEINKETTQSYLRDTKYIEFLVDKINTKEYDLDNLLEQEQDAILEHLRNQNS